MRAARDFDMPLRFSARYLRLFLIDLPAMTSWVGERSRSDQSPRAEIPAACDAVHKPASMDARRSAMIKRTFVVAAACAFSMNGFAQAPKSVKVQSTWPASITLQDHLR